MSDASTNDERTASTNDERTATAGGTPAAGATPLTDATPGQGADASTGQGDPVAPMREEPAPMRVEPVKSRSIEDKLPRGLWVRLFAYIIAGHLVAAFLYLLFTLGEHSQ
ncbi:DUF6126 family protein [Streptomyces tsukubensis]|uniref:Small hydrophobic protein n=1 Tax=Streptomyces tsukubensis TaxID=83656 RepID=A0A1V4ACZ6_9ACTN|nr:hypothetical protein B1H18_07050 [Streptomyces tsukubensis]